ncbi:MAG TPA: recombinase family protein [Candidatus Angelobacter sp.]|nr:recombinase family protein [Candidatus Angelobacter sp.]
MSQLPQVNAIAAIRVSTTKQGTDGDSPEAQKEQIERFAITRGITIKKFFVLLESASKEQQPMQEVIDYCKNPVNNIQLFVIKSIDRFTRGGSFSYDFLKMQLDKINVALVDVYGVISSQKVNTLDHLGFEYRWSVYSPSKKSEILEAERAKDEMRDIMSRMIGAEIRYTQLGFWMRKPPYGYVNEKVETPNGKRCVLKPHLTESELIIKMFKLRAQGELSDSQIVDKINELGFKTHVTYIHSPNDPMKIIRQVGGNKLTIKALDRILTHTVYAGIINEKWTQHKPIKGHFEGLISFELFNRANRGKLVLHESSDGDIELERHLREFHSKRGTRNDEFPYKRFVTCPICHKPFLGSLSRGRLGKYYPGYHCSNHGHYYRVPKKEFDETIMLFVKSLQVDSIYLDKIMDSVVSEWDKKQFNLQKDTQIIDERINGLQLQTRMLLEKMKMLSSAVAVQYIEDDIIKNENEITKLRESQNDKQSIEQPVNARIIVAYAKYFMEHLHELLIDHRNPTTKAAYFSVLFDKAPTYQEIKDGTLKTAQLPEVNELFRAINCNNGLLAGARGIEPRS